MRRGLKKKGRAKAAVVQGKLSLDGDPESHGESEESLSEGQDAAVRASSATLPSPT